MKRYPAFMTVLLTGALALPVMAQSTASSAPGSDPSSAQQSSQQGQQPSASTSPGTGDQTAMPQSDQQADKGAGAKKSKAKKGDEAATASTGTSMKTPSRKDRLFMEKAAAGGLEEVDLGNAVKDKAASQDVKDFAGKMVTDHSKANDELKALMEQKGLSAPTAIPAKNKSADDKIKAKQGAELDKAYMSDMVKDHDADVKAFQNAAKGADDPDVKAWAAKTLPTLQEHQKMANDIAQKVGAEGNMKHNHEAKKEVKKESKNP